MQLNMMLHSINIMLQIYFAIAFTDYMTNRRCDYIRTDQLRSRATTHKHIPFAFAGLAYSADDNEMLRMSVANWKYEICS